MSTPAKDDRDLVAIAKAIEELLGFEGGTSGWEVVRILKHVPLALIRIDERLKALESRDE